MLRVKHIITNFITRLFAQKNEAKLAYESIIYQRLYVITIVFGVIFTLLSLKLVKVSITDKITNIANEFHNIEVARNEITDRNGVLLAVDLATVSLYANPKLIMDPVQTASKLHDIFPDLKKPALIKTLQDRNKSFVWVKRNITPKQQYNVNNLGNPALEFEKGYRRVYTQGSLFSHVLGYVDTDGKGIAGIEKQFDQELQEPKRKKLQLSLDVRVQNIVHDELSKSIKEFRAKGGVGVVMDINNGEIISMVSLPDFDPHHPNLAATESMFNQASLGTYELGSIVKSLTIAAAIETKTVSLNDVYYVKAPLKASRFLIHDYMPKYNWLSVPEIFMYSSNIGTAMISLEVGIDTHKKFLKHFGLFDPLEIELPEKGLPIYPNDQNWNEVSTITISFGHGIAITPIHFIRAAASLVNGGYLHKLSLLKRTNLNQQPITRVLSKETSMIMRKLMRLTVENGTGRKANAKGYLVGGKSGSAEKAQKGKYNKTEKLSSFVAAFPINNPKYITLVILDDPRPTNTVKYTSGGWTAAPLTERIISRIAPILDVQPVNPDDTEIRNQLWLDFKPDAEIVEASF